MAAYLANVDSRSAVALRVFVSQLGDDRDGIEAGVLGQRVGNDLERLGEGADAEAVHTREGLGPVGELERDLDLGRTATGDHGPSLDERAHDAQRIVHRSLALVEQHLVASTAKDADRATGVGDARDLDDLAAARVLLLDQVGRTELRRREALDTRDRCAAQSLRHE